MDASDPYWRRRLVEYRLNMTRVRRIIFSLTATLLFTVSGCCKTFDSLTKQENAEALGWVTESWTGQYDWKDIPQWNRVTESKVSQAKAILQSRAAVKITGEQARDLTDEFGFDETKGAPYLLRAVGDAKGTFPVDPTVRPNGDVWVNGGANSKCPVARQRRAVVVWLEKMPEKVYVTFSVNTD